jgi:hypothetical protein
MTSRLIVKDYRGLTKLTPEQEQQLAAARLAAQQHQHVTAAAQQLPAALQTPAPTARLNTGYEIPLVGLGTWWVLQPAVSACNLVSVAALAGIAAAQSAPWAILTTQVPNEPTCIRSAT